MDFKIGDRIKNVCTTTSNYRKLGRVSSVDDNTVRVTYDDGCSGVWERESPQELCTCYQLISEKTIMSKLNSMMKRLLNEDTQTLYKAGIINGDLELTSEGNKILSAILFSANQTALIEEAKAIIAEQEKTK